ncbi:MAG: hypothetical protein H0T79_01640 [Deltaproteobacteria bacterium]|nr:hypothetical protein [Deltaproteobacteria bacterium]
MAFPDDHPAPPEVALHAGDARAVHARGIRPRSIAFAGAVFGWPYYAGVAAYLQADTARCPIARLYGTSSGAVVATMLACGIDLATEGLELGLRADAAGLAGRRTSFLRARRFLEPHLHEMDRALPSDAHERASGRLFITVRQVRGWRRLVISEFPTRDALLDTLAGAVAVPGLTVPLVHVSPRLGAVVDGGPAVDSDDRAEVSTVRVGIRPGAGYHIAPAAPFAWRMLLTIAPPARRREMFERGRADAARYFRAMGTLVP